MPSYRSLRECVADLERNGHLVRVSEEVDPNLDMAEIQRRAYRRQTPALLFERVKGSPFPAVCNLYGTQERVRFMFRDTLPLVKEAVKVHADTGRYLKDFVREGWRRPQHWLPLPLTGLRTLPKAQRPESAPVMQAQTTLDRLPAIKSWPKDGGPFITMPQVYSEDPGQPGILNSNLGAYRIQLAGNDYLPNREVGFHYQLHRGIGIHHTQAIARGEPLKVSVFVGGHPAHLFAAVMPLPEGMSELLFAGMLAGRRFRYVRHQGHVLSAEADFCLTGTIDLEQTKPEGPFGDHLGYYSLAHDFPVMRVEAVYHRKDAIWPFTVVGRPPQEDTVFGEIIHEITQPMVPEELPGVHAVHAVDAAGVHPLLLALGSERYVPYAAREPREILTQANAILGFNQCSLAKYVFIAAVDDDADLNVYAIDDFLVHCLKRIDFTRDLHFQTSTTMDTLDYSGQGLNRGSKLVLAAAGDPVRELGRDVPENLSLGDRFGRPRCVLPGILALQAPEFTDYATEQAVVGAMTALLARQSLEHWPLIVLCDDSEFTASELDNFLWVAFTRSDPARDCYGVEAFQEFKHWGCRGSLIIDARIKPHHAPPLEEDPETVRRVDALCAEGKSLHGVLA